MQQQQESDFEAQGMRPLKVFLLSQTDLLSQLFTK